MRRAKRQQTATAGGGIVDNKGRGDEKAAEMAMPLFGTNCDTWMEKRQQTATHATAFGTSVDVRRMVAPPHPM